MLGVALGSMARLALGPSHREAGDRHSMAPARFPAVLDLEKPAAHRTTRHASRRARADPGVVDRESALGAPRIHGELLGESVDRRQVHAAASEHAVTNVADLPHEPREPDHGRRPVRRADRHVPAALRTRHPRAGPRAAQTGALPLGRVEETATRRRNEMLWPKTVSRILSSSATSFAGASVLSTRTTFRLGSCGRTYRDCRSRVFR